MNRVRDCERKWLRRIDEEVRGKRGDEYGATRVKRHLRQARANGSAVPSPPEPPCALPRAVSRSGSGSSSRLDFKDSREMNCDDRQANPGSWPRAPPADGRLVVD